MKEETVETCGLDKPFSLDDLIHRAEAEVRKSPLRKLIMEKRTTKVIKTEKQLYELGAECASGLYVIKNEEGLILEVYRERRQGDYERVAQRNL